MSKQLRLFEKEAIEGPTKIFSKSTSKKTAQEVLLWAKYLKEVEGKDKRYKPKFSTQYHLKPELPYTCIAIKRPCTITPPYGNFAGCIGCTYREPVREPKHKKGVNHERTKSFKV